MTTAVVDNPYVGPRTFEERERHLFFGRDREAKELLSLVISERLVLFYAQSGAGKSSILNARLIPGLRTEGFAVLPTGRVSGQLPEGVADVENIFVFNLLLKLFEGQEEPNRLTHMPLSDALQAVALRAELPTLLEDTIEAEEEVLAESPARVLIIDQFEEIVTSHLEHWTRREDFFRQLNQAMADDPLLWVVLSMREDHVASLDPYASLLPNNLRTRFHMQRMGRRAAQEAIEKPAETHGRPFAPNVAERLVDNLRQIRIPGEPGAHYGQFVEPVQLQVVCYQLWENLKDKPPAEITQQDLDELGNVDEALGQFYEQAIKRALDQTGGSEAELRDWFENDLITEAGTRGIVYRGRTRTAGMGNKTVDALASQFLLRSETRAGGIWYELVHDRFIGPIQQANRRWQLQQGPLFQAAQVWRKAGQDETRLLVGQQLTEVMTGLGQPGSRQWQAQEPVVREYLEACLAAEGRRQAEEAEKTHQLAQAQALAEAERLRAEAERERAEAQWQRAEAETKAKRNQTIVVGLLAAGLLVMVGLIIFVRGQQDLLRQRSSFQLVIQAARQFDQELDRASLLSIEANRITGLPEIQSNLFEAITNNPRLITFLHGHTQYVWDVALSPDGQLLASASEDQTIRLWDVAGHEPVGQPLRGHIGKVYTLAFSPDGQTLASGGEDQRIVLWDVATREPLGQPLVGHSAAVYSLEFNSAGTRLVSGGADNTVIVWDMTTRQPLLPPLSGHSDWVWDVAFSPDDQIIASAGRDSVVILWDAQTGRPIGSPLRGHSNAVTEVAFSPDGYTLASGDADGKVRLWDVATHLPLADPLEGHTNTVWSIAFSPDGRTLATGSQDSRIILWDTLTRKQIDQPLLGHSSSVTEIIFASDSQTLISSSWDQKIILWNIANRQRLGQVLRPRVGPIWAVTFSPDDKLLASGDRQGGVTFWDRASNEPLGPPTVVHKSAVNRLAFSPKGDLLASVSDDQTIRLWDTNTRQPLDPPLTGHNNPVLGVAFRPDGQTLASSDANGMIMLWDITNRKPRGDSIAAHEGPARSVAFSPDGSLLASAGDDGQVRLWEVDSGKLRGVLRGHTGGVFDVAFSPDGSRLASSGRDQTVILWDVQAQTPLGQPLRGHTNWVYQAAFSPAGDRLVSAGRDGNLNLWDVETRQRLGQPLTGHLGSIFSVAFSPDGQTIASGSQDETIILWQIAFEQLTEQVCGLANRNLTLPEWQTYLGDGLAYRKTCPNLPLPPDFLQIDEEMKDRRGVEAVVNRFRRLLRNTSLDGDLRTYIREYFARQMIEEGETLIQSDDLAGAIAQFQEAARLVPDLGFDPQTIGRQIAVEQALTAGRAKAAEGNVVEAADHFREALELDPTLDLNPEAEAYLLAGQAKAGQGEIRTAISDLEQARRLDPRLTFDPTSKANQIVLQSDIGRVLQLKNSSTLTDTRIVLVQAQLQDPAEPAIWDVRCRLEQNLTACNRTIRLAPEAAWAYASRARVRAAQTDFAGAMDDLQVVYTQLKQNPLFNLESLPINTWLASLKAGQNPFVTPASN